MLLGYISQDSIPAYLTTLSTDFQPISFPALIHHLKPLEIPRASKSLSRVSLRSCGGADLLLITFPSTIYCFFSSKTFILLFPFTETSGFLFCCFFLSFSGVSGKKENKCVGEGDQSILFSDKSPFLSLRTNT